MDKIRVFIIDEHRAVCTALAARLRCVPSIEVVGALSTLREGLDLLYSARPHVVLLDLINKTEGSSESLGSIVYALSGGPVGVIVLTSYADEVEQNRAMQAGARRYLLKDIDTLRLINEIEAVAEETASHPLLIPPADRPCAKARLN
jgi:DNA-binding NarL/FixJ family response regulator